MFQTCDDITAAVNHPLPLTSLCCANYSAPYCKTSCRFVHVSSAGVTRPNRPGINVDQEPPAVKLNDALGGLLTYKLAGEDVIRGSGLPYVIVRPCALTEEPAGAPLEIDQGDVIKVGFMGFKMVCGLGFWSLGYNCGSWCALDTRGLLVPRWRLTRGMSSR
jgi:hypothetical protein